MMNKKGDSEELIGTIIFMTLNIMFFSIMFLYASNNTSQDKLIEQSGAKQIALLLDGSEENSTFFLDVSDWAKAAKNNEYSGNLLNVSEETNEVKVKVSNSGGYTMTYFTNYNVTYNIDKRDDRAFLVLVVGGKNEGIR